MCLDRVIYKNNKTAQAKLIPIIFTGEKCYIGIKRFHGYAHCLRSPYQGSQKNYPVNRWVNELEYCHSDVESHIRACSDRSYPKGFHITAPNIGSLRCGLGNVDYRQVVFKNFTLGYDHGDLTAVAKDMLILRRKDEFPLADLLPDLSK